MLAERTALTVVSADSRQLYCGFDVGTAKPTREELAAVPHRGIDVLDPTERASAAWWAEGADRWIAEAVAEGRAPLVVGGTGLYLRSLFGAFFEEPPLDGARRANIQLALAALSVDELRRWVTELDPARSHLGRTQLLRAIEVALLTGRRVSDLHRELARAPRRRARYLVVDPGPVLASRIARRTRTMLEGGWPEEVRALMSAVPADAPAWNASGYRTVREMEQGRLSAREAEERIIIETRQYAKRQRTWFRHQLTGEDVTLLSTEQPDWAERAVDWWTGGMESE
jgi:tRNA dimethylallyltransferase